MISNGNPPQEFKGNSIPSVAGLGQAVKSRSPDIVQPRQSEKTCMGGKLLEELTIGIGKPPPNSPEGLVDLILDFSE